MSGERVIQFGARGRALFGIAHVPERPRSTGIVILVGGPSYRVGSHRMFVQMARAFASEGYAVLRFDFAGMGDSEGEFPGFERLDGEIGSAIAQLRATCPALRDVALIGLCDGATAAAYYAGSGSRLAGVVLLNPWVHTQAAQAKTYMRHYYSRRVLQAEFWRSLVRGRIAWADVKDFFEKLLRVGIRAGAGAPGNFIDRMRVALQTYGGPLVVVASENDFTASEFTDLWAQDARWQSVRASAVFVPLAGADHTLSAAKDLNTFCRTVCEWLGGTAARAT